MKFCSKCNIEKPTIDFSRRNDHGSLQSWCKLCLSTYNKKIYKEKPHRRNQVKLCSAKYRVILEQFLFDHLRDKKFNISAHLKSTSLELIKSEVDKCQILCANCHSVKTATESKNWKLKWLNMPSV